MPKITVYVHAFEYVNGTEAGGGGFDWYWEAATADAAYSNAPTGDGDAHFRFDVEIELDPIMASAITDWIDSDLIYLTATAATRKVGRDVLAYWQANDFKMGDAANPAVVE